MEIILFFIFLVVLYIVVDHYLPDPPAITKDNVVSIKQKEQA